MIPENINAFFIGEPEYVKRLNYYFPSAECVLFDFERLRYSISSTLIRRNPMKYWDYILGAARPFFAKKVLITGTESCGKSTMVKYLAKLYHTSWSEEAGRYYASKYLGGNEEIFTDEDFGRIAHIQYEQDYQAMRTSNKVVFFDTDAVVTQYYSRLYMGHDNDIVAKYINPDKYDILIMLKPDVKWVDDGMRLNGDQERRWKLHEDLKKMYVDAGFKNIVEVGGNYSERLNSILPIIDNLIK
jgi:HTH-type transcriptional repressor of NAD biosynthesis genes